MNLTPKAKTLLTIAESIADQYGNEYVGTEHILVALIRMNHGVSGAVLEECKVTEDKLKIILNP